MVNREEAIEASIKVLEERLVDNLDKILQLSVHLEYYNNKEVKDNTETLIKIKENENQHLEETIRILKELIS